MRQQSPLYEISIKIKLILWSNIWLRYRIKRKPLQLLMWIKWLSFLQYSCRPIAAQLLTLSNTHTHLFNIISPEREEWTSSTAILTSCKMNFLMLVDISPGSSHCPSLCCDCVVVCFWTPWHKWTHTTNDTKSSTFSSETHDETCSIANSWYSLGKHFPYADKR